MINLNDLIRNNLLLEAKSDDKYWDGIAKMQEAGKNGTTYKKDMEFLKKHFGKDFENFQKWTKEKASELYKAASEAGADLDEDDLVDGSFASVWKGKEDYEKNLKEPKKLENRGFEGMLLKDDFGEFEHEPKKEEKKEDPKDEPKDEPKSDDKGNDSKGKSDDDDDKYWKMVDSVREGKGGIEEKMAKLRRKLGKDEFEKFTDWVGDKAWAAQSAAEDSELDMSDDALQYASFGAVLAGKESYEYALEAPDELSSYEKEGEEFCYGQDPEGDFDDDPEDDGEDEPKKDKDGNILKDEEVKDPKTGKKIKVVTHTGPRGGKFYWPDGVPKDNKHKVYVKEEMFSLCDYINSKFD